MSFSKKTLQFLAENHLHNSREWYSENKADYTEFVLEPFRDLVNQLAPAMLEIDPLFIVDPKVDKCISRIYKDTRFSKDKSLYRENMWITFMREKKLYLGLPAYYFELSPSGFAYGMGYYLATPQAMECLRSLALKNDSAFLKAKSAYERQSVFTLDGDQYKRSKYPEMSSDMRLWLDRKNIFFSAASKDFDLLFSQRLADKLIEEFNLIRPVYEFLCKCELLKSR